MYSGKKAQDHIPRRDKHHEHELSKHMILLF